MDRVFLPGVVLLALLAGQCTAAEKFPTTAPAREKPLERTIRSFEFNGTLDEAIRTLSTVGGVKISADWPALKAAGVSKGKKLRVTAEGARVGQLLDMVLVRAAVRGKPLSWYENAGRVRVTTQRKARVGRRRKLLRNLRRRRTLRSVDFQQIPFEDVVQFLREVTGANIHVNWRALKAVGVKREAPVTLRMSRISAAQVLDYVVDQLTEPVDKYRRVYWIVDEGIVRISTGSALNTRLTTRVYPLGDLLFAAPKVQMPTRIGLKTSKDQKGGGSGGLWGDDDDGDGEESGQSDFVERQRKTGDDLIDIVKDSIGPDMWQPEGKGSIRIHRNRLIISQTLLGFQLLERSLRRR